MPPNCPTKYSKALSHSYLLRYFLWSFCSNFTVNKLFLFTETGSVDFINLTMVHFVFPEDSRFGFCMFFNKINGYWGEKFLHVYRLKSLFLSGSEFLLLLYDSFKAALGATWADRHILVIPTHYPTECLPKNAAHPSPSTLLWLSTISFSPTVKERWRSKLRERCKIINSSIKSVSGKIWGLSD